MKLLVGTFSQPVSGMDAQGEGIYAVSFDPVLARFSEPELLLACVNPSALVSDPKTHSLFMTKEVLASESPALTSVSLTDGLAAPRSKLSLTGALPCHVTFDPNTKRVASAQYQTGDIVICRTEDGVFQGESTTLQNSGSGPNPVRQQGPHAHCVAFSDNGSVLHSVDLGSDLIISYRLDKGDNPTETARLSVPPGCGPRHIAITDDGMRAYVICELSEDLIALRRSGLGWEIVGQMKAFDQLDGRDGACAAIRLSENEQHLYVSGRHQSQIALFDVANKPHLIETIESGGDCPRDFILSQCGDWVFCGNQNSGTVTALPRNSLDGRMSLSVAQCEIFSPVAILEIP